VRAGFAVKIQIETIVDGYYEKRRIATTPIDYSWINIPMSERDRRKAVITGEIKPRHGDDSWLNSMTQ
jgi:hypothetical protein